MPLGAPVEYDDITKRLQKDLELQFFPAVFLRIGKPSRPTPIAPRLNLEKVINVN